MKTDDLLRAILAILPGASIDEDFEGQLVIYTDKKEDPDGNLIDFVSPLPDDEG
jgi:hypothetical protein